MPANKSKLKRKYSKAAETLQPEDPTDNAEQKDSADEDLLFESNEEVDSSDELEFESSDEADSSDEVDSDDGNSGEDVDSGDGDDEGGSNDEKETNDKAEESDEEEESDDNDSEDEDSTDDDIIIDYDNDGKSGEKEIGTRSNGIEKLDKTKKIEIKELVENIKTGKSEDKVDKLANKKLKARKDALVKQLTPNPKDEYADGDTSDEEDIRNTIGNIPVDWYEDYKHIGYDWEGKRIVKPDHGDLLDYFLRRMEDPTFWKTVRDRNTGQDVLLSEKDASLINRLESQKIPDEAYDAYAPWIEWFSSEVMKMPLRKFPEHKRSFLPSKDEKLKVAKMVHALKMGWMKTTKQMLKEKKKKEEAGPQFSMLWQGDNISEKMRRIHKHIPAPKRPLPGHAESYNPPPEFLFTDKEMKKFAESKRSLGNKKLHFIPKKYDSLRKVPSYKRFIIERFNRCMDLYLCPRAVKMRLMVEPEDLLPKLPSPKDLQPFPTMHALVFEGHTDMIRSMSLDPLGQYVVSGSDDQTIKFWELSTGRCLKTVPVGGVVRCVRWCPSQALSLVAVAADRKCLIVNPRLGDSLVVSKTDVLLKNPPPQDGIVPDRVKTSVEWQWQDETTQKDGILVIINHFKEIKQLAWHGRGDYFATVMPEGANRSVIIHQLSKGKSQLPFSRSKGLIQCVIFHPIRPFFFVATQRHVRVYDLVKQEMTKKLYSNAKWISNIAIHPGGDNILLSTYDSKVVWLDLDLSTKPYKTLRLHHTAVRSVAFHRRYPLFASVSDDCSLIISHGMVYNDLMQNAMIVPLKRMTNHKNANDFGIFEVMFHHTQPWVLTCGADRTIRLYS